MNKYLVECIATFFLFLLIGISAVLGTAGDLSPLAYGIGLVALVYMGGPISGAHFNPAVTLCLFIRGRCKGDEVAPYMAAEFIGAALGALTVRYVFAGHILVDGAPATISQWVPGGSGPVIAAEALFTFLLCFVILNVTTSKTTAGNSYYGAAIGFTVMASAFTADSISLASFNPAVTLGLAITGRLGWADTWMHLIPQVLGAVLAAFAFKGLYPDDK